LFVQALKVGASGEQEAVAVSKEYPRPTFEQLNQLGERGELVYTGLNEPGYPEVLALNTGSGVLPGVGGVGGRVVIIRREQIILSR
jgi:hypothetical protein